MIAKQILLVRPASFGYNPLTAESNAFQNRDYADADKQKIQESALREFSAMAEQLKNLGIEVLICDDAPEPFTPDAVFPNNWFSAHSDGTFCLYPMMAEPRRLERSADIINDLKKRFAVSRVVDLTDFEREGKFLEGTGSLILDHENRTTYASISPRTDEQVLDFWANAMNFEVVKFDAVDENGQAIYHTNVMMCLGDKFAVICLQSIKDESERQRVIDKLEKSGKLIVEISLRQMNEFAGNMLLLQNASGEKFLVMSKRAFDSLDQTQIETIESHAKLIAFDIPTIENCGGGSVRCMIAEIFWQNSVD